MNIQKICCPSCGAGIDEDIIVSKNVFCPYCGTWFHIDSGERIYTKNINIHKRYTDDAAVERERRLDRESEREYVRRESERKNAVKSEALTMILLIAAIVGLLMFSAVMNICSDVKDSFAYRSGKIQVGQCASDMEGENYKAVKEQLKSAGFTNITVVDLDNAGIFRNRKDTVDSVSIGGKTSFSSSTFFDPDSKVVIAYH